MAKKSLFNEPLDHLEKEAMRLRDKGTPPAQFNELMDQAFKAAFAPLLASVAREKTS